MSAPRELFIARQQVALGLDAVAELERMVCEGEYDLYVIKDLLKTGAADLMSAEHFTDLAIDQLAGLEPGTTTAALAVAKGDIHAVAPPGMFDTDPDSVPPARLAVVGTSGNITRIGVPSRPATDPVTPTPNQSA